MTEDLDYEAVIVSTHLLDRSNENNPSTYKLHFLENTLRSRPWKNGEIPAMVDDLSKSSLLKPGLIGTVVCFSDRREGISKIFYYNPRMRYLTNGPLAVRNLNLEISQDYSLKDSVAIGKVRVPEMTCRAEEEIVGFDHGLLCEEGLTMFQEKWYPNNMFKSKKVNIKD